MPSTRIILSMAPVQPNSDFFAVRHASVNPTPPTPGRLQVQSDRMIAAMFANGLPPAMPPASTTHDLIVNGYYVSPQSRLGANVPSLRRQTLVAGPGGAPQLQDQEVIPGVQDMQVRLGIDTDPIGSPNRGTADRYSDPGDPILNPASPFFNPNAQVVAVQVAGTMTVNGTPRQVVWEVEAVKDGPVLSVTGELDITLTEFGLTPPTLAFVRVEDEAHLEVLFQANGS